MAYIDNEELNDIRSKANIVDIKSITLKTILAINFFFNLFHIISSHKQIFILNYNKLLKIRLHIINFCWINWHFIL